MKTNVKGAKSSTPKIDVYHLVTDRICRALEQGTIPWKRSWKAFGPPQNYSSKHVYRGINAILTSLTPYEIPYFLTLKQANSLGGSIKKRAKSIPIVYWNMILKDESGQTVLEGMQSDENLTKVFFAKYYSVFNIEDIDGIDFSDIELASNIDPIPKCDELIENMPKKPIITFGGNQAFYTPPVDTVNMPPRSKFDSIESYYSVLFHELIHSTGHHDRLNRDDVMMEIKLASMNYSQEELTAEIGAAYLCNLVGVETDKTFSNTAGYIQGWLEKLKGDKKYIFYAARQAKRAVEYILGS